MSNQHDGASRNEIVMQDPLHQFLLTCRDVNRAHGHVNPCLTMGSYIMNLQPPLSGDVNNLSPVETWPIPLTVNARSSIYWIFILSQESPSKKH